jgi:DNA-binding response OmpR family regulator
MSPTSRRVLVVDDDAVIRRVVRTVLEADEFEVLEAGDGNAAITVAADTRPTVVVLDVMMPGLDGVEVCRRLRGGGEPVRVLMLTAVDDPETEKASVAAGADGYLQKPFSSVELLDRVEALAGGRP